MKNTLELLEKLLQRESKASVANKLNVNTNTVSRWVTLNSVPHQYYFDLVKLLGEKIDYSQFEFKDKDQFFTSNETAKNCFDIVKRVLGENGIDYNKYSFIEPSAGDGAFLPYLPENSLAFDIEPRNENIITQDFLDWKPQDEKNYITIGNPPFGLRGHLALKFINHAMQFSDFVCFILPPLFNSDGKGTPKKRVNGMSLLHTEDIDSQYFYPDGTPVSVNTIFQIWTKLPLIEDNVEDLKPIGYSIYSLSDGGTPSSTRNKDKLDKCDIYLPSTCFGEDNMKVYSSFEELPQRRGYGIILEDKELKDIITGIVWKDVAFFSTNGAINLRTSLIVRAIEECKGD